MTRTKPRNPAKRTLKFHRNQTPVNVTGVFFCQPKPPLRLPNPSYLMESTGYQCGNIRIPDLTHHGVKSIPPLTGI